MNCVLVSQPLKDMRDFGANVPEWDAKFIDLELQILFKLILVQFEQKLCLVFFHLLFPSILILCLMH